MPCDTSDDTKSHKTSDCELTPKKQPEIASRPPPILERKRKNRLPNVDRNLKYLRTRIESGHQFKWSANEKTTNDLHGGVSDRRSKYLGVSRNNQRFQTLLNIRNKKQYIGTFCDELEAAIAYDFYSIAIKKTKGHD